MGETRSLGHCQWRLLLTWNGNSQSKYFSKYFIEWPFCFKIFQMRIKNYIFFALYKRKKLPYSYYGLIWRVVWWYGKMCGAVPSLIWSQLAKEAWKIINEISCLVSIARVLNKNMDFLNFWLTPDRTNSIYSYFI